MGRFIVEVEANFLFFTTMNLKINGLILVSVMMLCIAKIDAQIIPAASNPVCEYCGTPLPYGVHKPGCPYAVAAGSSSSSSSTKKSAVNSAPNYSTMFVGAMFQGMLNSIFSSSSSEAPKGPTPEEQAIMVANQQAAIRAAEQQRLNALKAQEEFNNMMQSYKLLDDSKDIQAKTLGTNDLDFKNLNGNAETLSTDARRQFENVKIPDVKTPDNKGATPFFGDTMPVADIQTLTDIDNNPDVVDLRDAKKYVTEKHEKDNSGIVSILNTILNEDQGGPIIHKPMCKDLGIKLRAYTNQRAQFLKTIDLAQNELDVWETANRNALVNAAKDGIEYFTGEFLEGLANRGKAAERLMGIYEKNLDQMQAAGVDIVELKEKIMRLKALSTIGNMAEFKSSMSDWQAFMKDGLSSLITKLSDSNNEIKEMMENPQLKDYFESEKPELNTLLDITKLAASNKVFGKWLAKKIPIVATIEISIKQTYNATDWLLSLNRIKEARKIMGGVLDTAKFIQKNIDDTYAALQDCSK